MNSEYVKLNGPEISYSKKNLLKSQIEILNATKCFEEYKKLRKEELFLKVALKTKIDETKQSLKLLETLLPKVKIKEKDENIPPEFKAISKKKLTLDQEIEALRRRLENLK